MHDLRIGKRDDREEKRRSFARVLPSSLPLLFTISPLANPSLWDSWGLGARGWRKNEPTYLTLLPVLRPCPAVQSTERRGDREKGWDGKRHLSIHSIFLPFPLVAFITSNSHKLATNEGKGKLLSRNALLIPLPYLSVPCHVTHSSFLLSLSLPYTSLSLRAMSWLLLSIQCWPGEREHELTHTIPPPSLFSVNSCDIRCRISWERKWAK